MIEKPPTLGDIISTYQYQQAKRSLADKFARVMADCKREDEREEADRAVLVECGNCDGTGRGRIFSTCLSCGGSGVWCDKGFSQRAQHE